MRMNLAKEVLDDLYELFNNLQDDLELDLQEGESGAKSYEASYRAIRKHTWVVLRKKIAKWKKKNSRVWIRTHLRKNPKVIGKKILKREKE